MSQKELLECGERIQNLRQAFNVREGIKPADFKPHARMMGQGDGNLPEGPLKGIEVPLEQLKNDYFAAMGWDPQTGRLNEDRAQALGISDLIGT